MATAAHNDVVDNGDLKQLSGATQFTGAPDFRIRRLISGKRSVKNTAFI